MPILPESAKNIVLPKLVPVKQLFPDDHIENIEAAIAEYVSVPENRGRPVDGCPLRISFVSEFSSHRSHLSHNALI